MDNICKICNQDINERSHFWKNHKIKEKDYFEQYFPRLDLYNQEKIQFKSEDSYFLTDFNTKPNLKKYIESISKPEALNYLKNWLIRRKNTKDLKYSLSEFELKTLLYPSISYINKYFGAGSYEKICLESGLLIKYDLNYCPQTKQNEELEYIVDTREQSVLPIKNFQVKCLNYGDYTIEKNNGIFIERKSLSDAISTLSGGYERFQKEIERCRSNNDYLIILIEEKFSNFQSFQYMPHIHSKCNWEFISHRVRELCYKYPLNIQFLCSNGRVEAVRVIEKIFQLKDKLRELDLQYLYNKGIL